MTMYTYGLVQCILHKDVIDHTNSYIRTHTLRHYRYDGKEKYECNATHCNAMDPEMCERGCFRKLFNIVNRLLWNIPGIISFYLGNSTMSVWCLWVCVCVCGVQLCSPAIGLDLKQRYCVYVANRMTLDSRTINETPHTNIFLKTFQLTRDQNQNRIAPKAMLIIFRAFVCIENHCKLRCTTIQPTNKAPLKRDSCAYVLPHQAPLIKMNWFWFRISVIWMRIAYDYLFVRKYFIFYLSTMIFVAGNDLLCLRCVCAEIQL